MAKNEGGFGWLWWVLGGAALGVGGYALGFSRGQPVPQPPKPWWERYRGLIAFDSAPNRIILDDARYHLAKDMSAVGVKYDAHKGVTWESVNNGTFIVDITQLSKEDRVKAAQVVPGNIYGNGVTIRIKG
jgi:hypothetical protein